ncbi:MAG TPA: hypothetical protein VF060_23505 [Trebonia sp.]
MPGQIVIRGKCSACRHVRHNECLLKLGTGQCRCWQCYGKSWKAQARRELASGHATLDTVEKLYAGTIQRDDRTLKSLAPRMVPYTCAWCHKKGMTTSHGPKRRFCPKGNCKSADYRFRKKQQLLEQQQPVVQQVDPATQPEPEPLVQHGIERYVPGVAADGTYIPDIRYPDGHGGWLKPGYRPVVVQPERVERDPAGDEAGQVHPEPVRPAEEVQVDVQPAEPVQPEPAAAQPVLQLAEPVLRPDVQVQHDPDPVVVDIDVDPEQVGTDVILHEDEVEAVEAEVQADEVDPVAGGPEQAGDPVPDPEPSWASGATWAQLMRGSW